MNKMRGQKCVNWVEKEEAEKMSSCGTNVLCSSVLDGENQQDEEVA